MSKIIKKRKKADQLIINRLAAVLKEERVSNKELAETLDYEPATVSKWATNTIQPSLPTFMRIALTLERDLRDFFVSTKDMGEEEKKRVLKELAQMAKKAKRTGRVK